MHQIFVSVTCLMMIVAPCFVVLAGRFQADDLD